MPSRTPSEPESILTELRAIHRRLDGVEAQLTTLNGRNQDHAGRIIALETVGALASTNRTELQTDVRRLRSHLDRYSGTMATWKQTIAWLFQILTLAVALTAILLQR